MDQNEMAMYTGVTASRNTEVKLRWHRGEVFLALHVGMFSFVLIRPPQPFFLGIMSVLGMILGFIWIVTNVQTQRWINFWHERIEAMERNKDDPLHVNVYSSRRFRKVNTGFPTFYQILMTLAILVTAAWLSIGVYSLTRHL